MSLVRRDDYIIFPVSTAAWNDFRERLWREGELDQRLVIDEMHGEILILDSFKLVRDYKAEELVGKLVRFPHLLDPAGRVARAVEGMIEFDDSYMALPGQFSPGAFVVVEEQ